MNQIVKTNTQEIVNSIPDINGTIGAALALEDQSHSTKLIEEQAGLAFDMIRGEEIAFLEAEIDNQESSVKRSRQAIDEQEKVLFATSPTIKAAHIRNESTQSKSLFQFLIWSKDFTIGLSCLICGLIVVLMGASNVYSIIMASGTPVFLDDPRLAMMLSGLLPIGSIALKFFSATIQSDKFKKRYTTALYGAAAVSLIAWIVLFGMTFGSAASGFDWDSLGEDNTDKDATFTVVQLLTEMLVGATLFQVAGDIWSTYAPTTMIANPAYAERKRNLELLRGDHDELRKTYTQNTARLSMLMAARKAYINSQILHYQRQAARLHGDHSSALNKQKKEKSGMKKLLTLATLSMLCLGASPKAEAKNLVIGMSPVLSAEDGRRQMIQVLRYLSENLEVGEHANIFDAENRRFVGSFSKPANKNYASPKALLQYNRRVAANLKSMYRADHPDLASGIKASVKIPQFLTFLAQNYAPLTDTDIVILGSPIYMDLQTPSWDMRGGKFAGDGHFSAQADKSVFSTVGKETFLQGARIHILYPSKEWEISDSYRHYITRMWTLYIEAQGGELSSFTDDVSTFRMRVRNSAGALPHTFKREYTDKLETFEMAPEQRKRTSIHERELSTTLPSKSAMNIADEVEIGISWTCDVCDLDIYVRPNHVADVLYFGNTKTAEGLYHKDFVNSPQAVKGYETVTFKHAVDLRDTFIAINWYGGHSHSGVSGEIRLAIGDKTYGLPFHIKGENGNAALERDSVLSASKAANDNWIVIQPKKILGL
ncbi:MAG: hypothetical protein ACRBDL_07810 [Alphaproteobacteria bacterium]